MAGGKGTRLRAITNDEIPKPMAPVAGKPILERQMEHLREQGILDPATVNYAILETNGQLSVFPYAKYRPASAMDAGIEARDESLPVTVIADGRILRDNLRLTGRDRTWLDGCLRAQKCRRKDVLLLTVDGSGVVHMQRKGTRK